MRSAAALPSSVADSLSGCGQERTEAPPPRPDPHLNYLQRCRTLWERRFGNLLLPSATAAPSRPLPEFAAPPATAGFFPQQKVAPSAPCPRVLRALRVLTSTPHPGSLRCSFPLPPPRCQPLQALMGSFANPVHTPRSSAGSHFHTYREKQVLF